MDFRLLGRSGLKVSTLTLGTMTFGGKGKFVKTGNTDLAGARRQIVMCLEAGINFFDTADVYSDGLSEAMIGEVLEGRRDQLLLATKVRYSTGITPANTGGLSRHHIMRACEASLKRLRTDRIDVYWMHEWDGLTPLEETLRALDDLTRSGKINYVGVSNFSGWHVMKTLAIAEREGLVRPIGQQIHYSLQAREAEYELLPLAVDQGLGSVIWSPLAGGLLSGKYRRGQAEPQGTRKAAQWREPPIHDVDALYDVIEAVVAVAEERGITAAQVALAWLLTRPSVASLVIGARTEEQLADNLKAAEIRLTAEEIDRLEAASRPPLLYPYWHQEMTAPDRLSAADLGLIAPYMASGS